MRCGIEPPKQVVTDFSLALLNAAAIAFGNMSLDEYIGQCYENVTKGQQIVNGTILRIDVAHLFKFVSSRWPSLNKRNVHKDFYVRCLKILRNSKTSIIR